jgi:hypothetical protein
MMKLIFESSLLPAEKQACNNEHFGRFHQTLGLIHPQSPPQTKLLPQNAFIRALKARLAAHLIPSFGFAV